MALSPGTQNAIFEEKIALYDGGNEGNASILTAIKETRIENVSSIGSNYWAKLARALNTEVSESSFNGRAAKRARVPLIETNANFMPAFYCPSNTWRDDKLTEKEMCELSLKLANCVGSTKSKSLGPVGRDKRLGLPITEREPDAPSPTSDIITFVPFAHRQKNKSTFSEPHEIRTSEAFDNPSLRNNKVYSQHPGKTTNKTLSSLPRYMLPTIAATKKNNSTKCVRPQPTSYDIAKSKHQRKSTIARSKTLKSIKTSTRPSIYESVSQLKQLCSSSQSS